MEEERLNERDENERLREPMREGGGEFTLGSLGQRTSSAIRGLPNHQDWGRKMSYWLRHRRVGQ